MIEECKVDSKQPPNIKNVEWKKFKIEIKKVNNTTENIEMKNLTDLSYLLKAAGRVIVKRLWVQQKSENSKSKSNTDSWW